MLDKFKKRLSVGASHADIFMHKGGQSASDNADPVSESIKMRHTHASSKTVFPLPTNKSSTSPFIQHLPLKNKVLGQWRGILEVLDKPDLWKR